MTSITKPTDFATGTITSSFTDFVLNALRCDALRARLLIADIESIDVALRGGFIDADGAIAWAAEVGVLDLIARSSVVTSVSS
jgi:hypothetical protein